MAPRPETPFQFGSWQVNPAEGTLMRGSESRKLEPLAMDVLVALCQRPGEVVGVETLLLDCWGSTLHGDNPVHKTIAQLRKALGDEPTAPAYIATIRKRGYQTRAAVRFADGQSSARPGSWPSSPFRGLEAFEERHAAVFQGRREAVAQLKESVLRQMAMGYALQLVLGSSGSGKTSLVRAGLIPALTAADGRDGARVVGTAIWDAGEAKEQNPFVSLAASLLDWEIGDKPVFSDISATDLGARLATETGWIDAALDAAFDGKPGWLLLFVDRFEALFTLPQWDDSQRQRLLDGLAEMARGTRVVVTVACRNDFYPQIVGLPALMAAKTNGGHFDLQPPTVAELAQMIRLPAFAAGLRFSADPASGERLDDALCRAAARSPDALPLLQYTLQELYRQCSASDGGSGAVIELTFEAYRSLGGLEGALGRRAEEVIGGLTTAQQEALPRVLARVVTVSAQDETVGSRSAAWSELHADAERELVNALVEARLFVSHYHDGDASYGVAHEALLRHWPRVTEWIEVHRKALRDRARLAAQTARWIDEERRADLLLPPGKLLEEAQSLLGIDALLLRADEKTLITESARKARWRARLRTGALTTIVTLACLAVVLGISATNARRTAEQKQAEAEDLLAYMLGEFADKLRPIGRLELLDSIGGKSLSRLAHNDRASVEERLQRAKALTVIAEVRVSKRDTQAAIEPLQAAEALLQGDPPKPELVAAWRKAQGAAAFWLGNAHYDLRQIDSAQTAFARYRAVSEQWLAARPEDDDARIELSYAENNLGTLYANQGRLGEGEQALQRSIDIKRQVLERQSGKDDLRAELATSLSRLGKLQMWRADHDRSVETFGQALALTASIRAQASDNLDWLQKEATSRMWLGTAWRQAGQFARARRIGRREEANRALAGGTTR